MHQITPRSLSQTDFDTYSTRWQQLVNSTDTEAMRKCFMSTSIDASSEIITYVPINYVYLPNKYALLLLSAVGTVAIRAKFVVVEDHNQEYFSIVLFGTDDSGNPTSGYYLAGVTQVIATLKEEISNQANPDDSINALDFDLAVSWINQWSKVSLDQIDMALFNSVYGPLLGYTYPLHDFMDALTPAVAGSSEAASSQALWLNLALHSYDKPGATSDAPSWLLSTILTLNTNPEGTDGADAVLTVAPNQYYYDVSKPCPPACWAVSPTLG